MAVDRKLHTTDEFEQFLALPENRERLFELIDGEIVEKMPTEAHGIIESYLAWLMNNIVIPNDLGRVMTNSRFKLSGEKHNSHLPDLAYRAHPTAPVVMQGAIQTLPDLAVEIKSPDDSDEELAAKARYYLQHGTRLVWLVFPEKRTIEVWHADQEVITLTGNDILTAEDILPGFAVPIDSIFARLDK